MAIRFLLSTLIVLRSLIPLAVLVTSWAANAQGGPERDAAALTAMQNSVSAVGGASGWAAIQDWTITGQVSTSGSGQQANFSWIGAGAEFHIETDSNGSTSVFLSGHGSPARIVNGTVSNLNYFVARANPPLYLPGVRLTQELNNQQLTIQYVGSTTVNGVAAGQPDMDGSMKKNEESYMPNCSYGFGYFAAFVMLFVMASMGQAASDPLLNAKLEEAIAQVRTNESPKARTEAAEHLAELTHRVKPNSVDDKTIADMVSLLDIPDDSVRAWTAAALGHLGRRAKVAAPKLLALLAEVDCLEGDLTSAAPIRPALKRMGVKPPPEPSYDDCHKAH